MMKKKPDDIELVIGDLHYIASRKKAIALAEESILTAIKGKRFSRIILLGDLFHKKPTALERCMLAGFLNKLRKHTKTIYFIIGNGKHTFEEENIHEQDWIDLCEDFTQHEELILGNKVFCHSEFKGLKYINGHKSESKREINQDYDYYSGHIHSPFCSFKNVTYVGSIYKVTFAEIDDQKRIGIITNNKVEWLEIKTRPMYCIELVGVGGKIKGKGLSELKNSGDTEIDLKIKAKTDRVSLQELHRVILKLKNKYSIEYYTEDIKITELKTDVPKNLDEKVLLKKYCEIKKTPFSLVEKELPKKRS